MLEVGAVSLRQFDKNSSVLLRQLSLCLLFGSVGRVVRDWLGKKVKHRLSFEHLGRRILPDG